MKALLALLLLLGGAIVVLGLPWADPGARRAPRFGGTTPILAMTFAHSDHPAVACTTCHHEFRDGRRSLPCMTCHVTDPTVAPLLEAQFHDLCRSCHVEERAAGKVAGPTRRCSSTCPTRPRPGGAAGLRAGVTSAPGSCKRAPPPARSLPHGESPIPARS